MVDRSFSDYYDTPENQIYLISAAGIAAVFAALGRLIKFPKIENFQNIYSLAYSWAQQRKFSSIILNLSKIQITSKFNYFWSMLNTGCKYYCWCCRCYSFFISSWSQWKRVFRSNQVNLNFEKWQANDFLDNLLQRYLVV